MGDGELTLDIGPREILVDTDGVRDLAHIDAGDRVTVHGEMDEADIFERRELLAQAITLLSPGS